MDNNNAKIDYEALVTSMMLSDMNKQNPVHAKIIKVLMREGLPIMKALAVITEISQIIAEAEDETE